VRASIEVNPRWMAVARLQLGHAAREVISRRNHSSRDLTAASCGPQLLTDLVAANPPAFRHPAALLTRLVDAQIKTVRKSRADAGVAFADTVGVRLVEVSNATASNRHPRCCTVRPLVPVPTQGTAAPLSGQPGDAADERPNNECRQGHRRHAGLGCEASDADNENAIGPGRSESPGDAGRRERARQEPARNAPAHDDDARAHGGDAEVTITDAPSATSGH